MVQLSRFLGVSKDGHHETQTPERHAPTGTVSSMSRSDRRLKRVVTETALDACTPARLLISSKPSSHHEDLRHPQLWNGQNEGVAEQRGVAFEAIDFRNDPLTRAGRSLGRRAR